MRFKGVDGLRGIAALGVAWFHMFTQCQTDETTFILPYWISVPSVWGRFGVQLFFVISGFVLAHSLQEKNIITKISDVFKYYVKRSIRLDPMYWVAIIFSILYAYSSIDLKHQNTEFPPIETLIINLFYLQKFFSVNEILDVGWTLTMEIQFYLFFAFILFLSHLVNNLYKAQSIGQVQFFFISLFGFLGLLWPFKIIPYMDAPFFPHYYLFTLGILCYHVIVNNSRKYKVTLLLYSIALFSSVLISKNSYVVAGLLSTCLIALAVHNKSIRKYLSNPILQTLGVLSYAIYLFHQQVGKTVVFIIDNFLFDIHSNGSLYLLSIVTGILVLILFSKVIYNLIEKNSITLSKKVKFKENEAIHTKVSKVNA